jgi:hypothetical protein
VGGSVLVVLQGIDAAMADVKPAYPPEPDLPANLVIT